MKCAEGTLYPRKIEYFRGRTYTLYIAQRHAFTICLFSLGKHKYASSKEDNAISYTRGNS